MQNLEYIENLIRIIKSDVFKSRLKIGLENFPNLKLESYIRNILVEMVNESSILEQKRAFAEFPRFTNENRKRICVDFSISSSTSTVFTMEMKYQFPKDFKDLNYRKVIEKDFCTRKYCAEEDGFVDAFLLIVCDWSEDIDRQTGFEKDWKLNQLSQYQFKKPNGQWRSDILDLFQGVTNDLENCNYKSLEIGGGNTRDFSADFHFHFLYRN